MRRRPRALIVDDHAMIRAVLAEMLERLGCEAQTAASGTEALSLVETFAPDVVLLDVRMPAMSGQDVLPRLRSGAARPAVIMLTGDHDADLRDRLMALGAAAVLEKPISIPALARAIGDTVGTLDL